MNLKELLLQLVDENEDQQVIIEDKDEGLTIEIDEVEFDRVNNVIKLVMGSYILEDDD